jgi:hypothetical protein
MTEGEIVARRFQFSLQNLLLAPASFAVAIGFVHAVSDLAFRAMYPLFGDDWLQSGVNALVAVGFSRSLVASQLVFVLLDVPGLAVIVFVGFCLGLLKRTWSDVVAWSLFAACPVADCLGSGVIIFLRHSTLTLLGVIFAALIWFVARRRGSLNPPSHSVLSAGLVIAAIAYFGIGMYGYHLLYYPPEIELS